MDWRIIVLTNVFTSTLALGNGRRHTLMGTATGLNGTIKLVNENLRAGSIEKEVSIMTKEDINSLWGVRDHLDEAFNRAGYDVCIVYQDFFQNDAVDVTDLRTKKS